MRAWQTSCPDWEKRIVAGETLIPNGPIFPDQADVALSIFKELILVDVPGQPPIGAVTRQWVYDFVGSIFGAYDAQTGMRMIQEFFLLIAKKNAKSTISAGIMLTALIMNWRHNAEFFIIAPTVEVANNSFKPAKAMINADEELQDLFQVQDHVRTITHRLTGATLKVIAAESDTVAGIKGTGVLIEEVWVFGKRAKAADMFVEAKGGLASRPEGFVIYLSTHSDEAPAGVFKELLQRFRDVRDGKVENKRIQPMLYEWPRHMTEQGLHLQPQNFYITNPNLGASVSESWLVGEFTTAEQTDEIALRRFMAKHLNVEIGLSLNSDSWVGGEFWQRQARPEMAGLDYLLANSEVVTIGIDGGGMDDLLGMGVVGRLKDDPKQWLVWGKAWANQIVLERRKQIASVLLDLQKSGDLTIVQNVGDDLREMAAIVRRIYDMGLFGGNGVDPWCSSIILDALKDVGFEDSDSAGVAQGARLFDAIKMTERKLSDGTLLHGGQELMNWVIGNAKVVPKGQVMLITKQASGSAKIDPLIGVFNAVELMSKNPEAKGASVYNTRGLRMV